MFSANSSQVSDDKLFVEDVFSTYLYTGTGAAQTITNGIDLAGKGGLVWVKSRSAATNNFLFDTARGVNVEINSNTADANATLANSVTAFNSNGFAISSAAGIGVNAATYASWTFREAPKFFDVVTWTGNGVNGRQIAHNLGVTPGCIMYKCTSTAADWLVLHRSLPNGFSDAMTLNTTDASFSLGSSFAPTATTFTMSNGVVWNQSGQTYVAYLYAHDATSDGFIQCGSYTGNGSATGPVVTLGWEPQWLMVKRASGTGNWQLLDNMRGLPVGSADATLQANLANAESSVDYVSPTATGFQVVSTSSEVNTNASTYIYMAIRRGPMRTPTLGTSVFAPSFGVGTLPSVPTGFVTDLGFLTYLGGGGQVNSRLTGPTDLYTYSTIAEQANGTVKFDYMTGWYGSGLSSSYIGWSFRRAPGFFDEVCYTGTGAQISVPHNLGVVPEIIITKRRNSTGSWLVYTATTGLNNYLSLNTTDAVASATNYSAVSATAFNAPFNNAGGTFVSYLFASCPGVSKVGSYTGNGSSQTINCGFAAGARFVMIKRTDSTGDWYVWDTARGIVAGNDPHLSLNTTAAEVTTDDTIDTASSGFVVNQDAATNVNVNAATYIYLAIA